MSETEIRDLAESGVSPWGHRAQIVNGSLVLYWRQKGKEMIRTFTKEETENMLHLLYDNRDEILTQK
jgi:hypothetical protein